MPPKRPPDLTPLIPPLGANPPSNDSASKPEFQSFNDANSDSLLGDNHHPCGNGYTSNEMEGGNLSSSPLVNSNNQRQTPLHLLHTPGTSVSGAAEGCCSCADHSHHSLGYKHKQQQEAVVITDSMTLVVMDANGNELRVKDGVFGNIASSRHDGSRDHNHYRERENTRDGIHQQHTSDTNGGSGANDNYSKGRDRGNNADGNPNNTSQQYSKKGAPNAQSEDSDRRTSEPRGKRDGRAPVNGKGNDRGMRESAENDQEYHPQNCNYKKHVRLTKNIRPQPTDPFLDNIQFDDLRIGMILGSGYHGKVRLVQHKEKSIPYALKYIKFQGDMEEARRVFSAELNRIQALRHINVATSHEAFFKNSRLCIVLDYMDCGNMGDIMGRNRAAFPEDMLAYVAKGLFSGLRHIHKEKVMHRDIKPANVLANSSGCVKVADFGVSRCFSGEGSQEFKTITVLGSRPYMCPEMVRNRPYSFGCDIWSAGLTIAECYVGNYPFAVSKNVSVFTLLDVILKGADAIDWSGRGGKGGGAVRMTSSQDKEGDDDKDCDDDEVVAPEGSPCPPFKSPPPPSPELRDFVKQCLRPAESRPTAADLLEHPFVAMGDRITPEYAGKWFANGNPLPLDAHCRKLPASSSDALDGGSAAGVLSGTHSQ